MKGVGEEDRSAGTIPGEEGAGGFAGAASLLAAILAPGK